MEEKFPLLKYGGEISPSYITMEGKFYVGSLEVHKISPPYIVMEGKFSQLVCICM